MHLELPGKIDLVAIYAALVATSLLIWNVFTWLRSGPRLTGTVSVNMRYFPPIDSANSSYLMIYVINSGNADTTITHVVLFGYKNPFARYFRSKKPAKTAIVNHAVDAYPIPFVLKLARPSCRWLGRTKT